MKKIEHWSKILIFNMWICCMNCHLLGIIHKLNHNIRIRLGSTWKIVYRAENFGTYWLFLHTFIQFHYDKGIGNLCNPCEEADMEIGKCEDLSLNFQSRTQKKGYTFWLLRISKSHNHKIVKRTIPINPI